MMISDGLCRMKFVAAYLLAVLAGNSSPSAEDLTAILESVGCEVDNERMEFAWRYNGTTT